MRNVLVVGRADAVPGLRSLLESRGCSVRASESVYDTEGLDVEVVVVASAVDLSDVRVHPRLHDVPVVLLAPGRPLDSDVWKRAGVWPVTDTGDDATKQAAAAVLGAVASSLLRTAV